SAAGANRAGRTVDVWVEFGGLSLRLGLHLYLDWLRYVVSQGPTSPLLIRSTSPSPSASTALSVPTNSAAGNTRGFWNVPPPLPASTAIPHRRAATRSGRRSPFRSAVTTGANPGFSPSSDSTCGKKPPPGLLRSTVTVPSKLAVARSSSPSPSKSAAA